MPVPDLKVDFDDPHGAFNGYRDKIRTTLDAAWDAWAQHLDSSAPITIEVRPEQNSDQLGLSAVAAMRTPFWYPTDQTTEDGGQISQNSFVQEIISLSPEGESFFGDNLMGTDATLILAQSASQFDYLNDGDQPVYKTDAYATFIHEIGHALGIADGAFGSGYPNIYDTHVEKTSDLDFASNAVFDGPEVREYVGAPVKLAGLDDAAHFADSDDVMNATTGSPGHVSRKDLAVLADMGLPVRENSLTGPIKGTPGDDIEIGTAYDDLYRATPGEDTFNGKGGIDTAVFDQPRSAFDYVGRGAVRGGDTDTFLDNVERIAFSDGTLAVAHEGAAGEVYRLYEAVFDRDPGPDGLGFWINRLDSGESSYSQMVESFLASPEYEQLYGTNPDAAAFVDTVYQNVLDRGPDDAGETYWLDQLTSGMPRSEVIAHFAESPENQQNVNDVFDDGVWFT